MSTQILSPGATPEVALWLFLRSLRASRLLSDEDLDTLSQSVNPDQIADVHAMLVEEGLLTPYQLRRVQDGTADGLVLGQYQLLDELGRGGFGRVYKARHVLMNRVVALKVITPGQVQGKMLRDLFLREVSVSTRLTHPNIVQAYDANEVDGSLLYAMEYIQGPTLEAHVLAQGPMPAAHVRLLLAQAGLALEYAHTQGVVHRDIKPANLLLPGRGDVAAGPDSSPPYVKVVDFGLARAFTRGSEASAATLFCHEGAIIGTPAYMAPEQAQNIHDTDIRSDLYSLGCTAYFALTGRPPFRGSTTQQLLATSRTEEAVPLSRLCPEAPTDLAAVVHRLMAKDPAQRYQTPTELIDALARPSSSWSLSLPDPPDAGDARPAGPPAATAGSEPPEAVTSESDTVTWLPAAGPTEPEMTPLPAFDLGSCWREWHALVERVGREAAPGIGAAEYKGLHRALLAAAQGAGGETGLRVYAVAEPWVTLQSLEAMSGRTRSELRDACRRVDTLLPASGERFPARLLAVAVVVVAAGAGLVVYREAVARLWGKISGLIALNPLVAVLVVVTVTLAATAAARGRSAR